MRILHLSDIHWRGFERHEEYTKIFNQFYQQAKELKPDIIVCTGDIFHTKTQNITPEVVDKLVWMFENCAKIAPLHLILGNHDGNLTNSNRQDAISPIIEAMKENKNIFLYKKSGTYNIPNFNTIKLHVFSCFDKHGWNNIKSENDKFNIALYHGSVNGCKMDNGTILSNGEVDISMFQPYDLVLLGDIHKTQIMAERENGPWIGYPGSFIQQSFGEEENKGFFVWDIDENNTKTVQCSFHVLANEKPFINFAWQGSPEETLKQLYDVREVIYPGTRLRILSSVFISPQEQKEFRSRMAAIGVNHIIFHSNAKNNIQKIETTTVTSNKKSLRNEPDSIIKLFQEYLLSNNKVSLSVDEFELAETLIRHYHKKIVDDKTNNDDVIRDVIWKVHSLEFNNLFQYGTNNKINFDLLDNQVVGILGRNRIGKSSILGTLMYALFNTSERNVSKAARIINKNKNEGDVSITFSVDNELYKASRTSKKKIGKNKTIDHESASTALVFDRLGANTITSENGDTRVDTDKIIREKIGTIDDFILTCYANNKNLASFIDGGPTHRKEVLNRFLDIDFFSLFLDYIKEDLNKIQANIANYTTIDILESKKINLDSQLILLESELKSIGNQINEIGALIQEKTVWLADNNVDSLMLFEKTKIATIKDIGVLERTLSEAMAYQIVLQEKIIATKTTTERLELELKKVDSIDDLHRKKKELDILKSKLLDNSKSYSKEQNILDTKLKSIKKLSLVPCGDQFPTCIYIKDSHQDKQMLENQQALVETLTNIQTTLEQEISIYYGIDETIEKRQNLMNKLLMSKKEYEFNDDQLERCLSNIQSTQKLLDEKKVFLSSFLNSCHSTSVSSDLISGIEKTTKELSGLKGSLKELETSQRKLLFQQGQVHVEHEQCLHSIEKLSKLLKEVRIYEALNVAFSKNGIPLLVLKTQIPLINLELSKILTNISDFSISFDTDMNTTSSFDIFIEDSHSKRVIELASGAEQTFAALAIRVALYNLSSLPKSDMFLMDEVFGALDEEHLPRIEEMLQMLKENFSKVILITHMPQIKDMVDKIIEVTHNNDESKVWSP